MLKPNDPRVFSNFAENLIFHLEAAHVSAAREGILENCGFIHFTNQGAGTRCEHSLYTGWAVVAIYNDFYCIIGHCDASQIESKKGWDERNGELFKGGEGKGLRKKSLVTKTCMESSREHS